MKTYTIENIKTMTWKEKCELMREIIRKEVDYEGQAYEYWWQKY